MSYLANVIGMLVVSTKAGMLVFVQIWVRWTLPRLRIDQVMTTCLKYCTPLAAACFLGVVLWQMYVPLSLNDHYGGGWLQLEERPTKSGGLICIWSDVSERVEAQAGNRLPLRGQLHLILQVDRRHGRDAVIACARSLREYSEMSPLEVWYARITADDILDLVSSPLVQERIEECRLLKLWTARTANRKHLRLVEA